MYRNEQIREPARGFRSLLEAIECKMDIDMRHSLERAFVVDEKILGFFKEFQDSHKALQAFSVSVKALIFWFPHPVGSLKLNNYASVKKGNLMYGIGAVIRNDKGWVVAALSKPLLGNLSPEAGEMVALREGLLLA
ncbi:hypothetical protein QYF36_012138 [Acer negundo]|nr:hypothetical protein QYF36_012138 [Acer negundo]